MKTSVLVLGIILTITTHVFAGPGQIGSAGGTNDLRNEAIKNSSVVKAVIKNLNSEQGLKCQIATDESGDETIQYIVENNRKKFIAMYLCSDGRSAVFKGILGDRKSVV